MWPDMSQSLQKNIGNPRVQRAGFYIPVYQSKKKIILHEVTTESKFILNFIP